MASQNEQIHIASWPIAMPDEENMFATDQTLAAAKYYAISNQVFYLMSSQIWNEQHRNRVCETEHQKNYMKMGYGFARIIAPNGRESGTPLRHDEEGITYADINLEKIIPGRYIIDTAGHYSTPGSLQLTFDKTMHKPVHIVGESAPDIISYNEIQFESD